MYLIADLLLTIFVMVMVLSELVQNCFRITQRVMASFVCALQREMMLRLCCCGKNTLKHDDMREILKPQLAMNMSVGWNNV